ncbi:DUF5372 family protein [Desulforhabdus sp. TSK]|uniref:DUF5372 family protein n=1 Tax=Desulforhabdus sp. TSK TaxID=2925014 RepID=UPI0034D6550C
MPKQVAGGFSPPPRSVHTALEPKSVPEWAEITHPFHPRRHQRFKVLRARRISGVCILTLQDPSSGIFTVSQEWTDLADPSVRVMEILFPTILHFESLLVLVNLLERLDPTRQEEGEKGEGGEGWFAQRFLEKNEPGRLGPSGHFSRSLLL